MTYSYTTPLLVQAELKQTTAFSIDTTPSYSDVQRIIQEESEKLNSDTGRVWGSTQYTTDIDYDGRSTFILLEHSPIISIDSFTYNQERLGSPNGTDYVTKTEDTDFTVYADKGRVDILFNNFSPKAGKKRFRITYTAGFSEVPLRVQSLMSKIVAYRLLSQALNNDLNERNDGGSVSVGSISIVEPENYGSKKYESLVKDIDRLKGDLGQDGFGVWRYDG